MRDPDRVAEQAAGWAFGDAEVVTVAFDATQADQHEAFVADVAERFGDLDVVIQAFGQLGEAGLDDPVVAAQLAQVNYVGAVSSGLAVAARLRAQGHGTLVVLSSVAGFARGHRTSSTGPPRPARTRLPPGSAMRSPAPAPEC